MEGANIKKIETQPHSDNEETLQIPKSFIKNNKNKTNKSKVNKINKNTNKEHSTENKNVMDTVVVDKGTKLLPSRNDSKNFMNSEISKDSNKTLEKDNQTKDGNAKVGQDTTMENVSDNNGCDSVAEKPDKHFSDNLYLNNYKKMSKNLSIEEKRMKEYNIEAQKEHLNESSLSMLKKVRNDIRQSQIKTNRNDSEDSESAKEIERGTNETKTILIENQDKETTKKNKEGTLIKPKYKKKKKKSKEIDEDYVEDDDETSESEYNIEKESNNRKDYVQKEIVMENGEIEIQYKRGRKEKHKKKQILLNDKDSSHFQINYNSINNINNISKQMKSDYRTYQTFRDVYSGKSNIAPPAQNLLIENSALKKHQLKWNRNIDDFNHVQPFNPEKGKVTFTDNDVRRYCKKVSCLTYECLVRINDELFNDEFDEKLLEELTWKLAGIPYYVKHNDSTMIQKDSKRDHFKSSNIHTTPSIDAFNQTTTLEEGELHPKTDENEKENNKISLNRTEILAKVPKNNHYYKIMEELCSTNTFDVTNKNKRMLDVLVGKGKIKDASRRAYTICNNDNDYYDNEITFNKLLRCHKFNKEETINLNKEPDTDNRNEEEDYSIFINDENELGEIISTLNGHSAAGANGWSIALIKMIISQNKLILKELMNFVNGLIAREYFPPFFFIGRVIAIKKNGPNQEGKIRPICITDAFRKIVARVLLHLHQKKLMENIPKEQYGVGTRNGATIITSIVEHSLDFSIEKKEDLYILQTDIDSAFPSVSRQMLVDALFEIGIHKSFIQFVFQSFKKEELLFFEGDSPRHIPCSKGVAQGCVLSPILFSIATRKIQQRINNNTISDSAYPPKCLSYLDDMFFISKSKEELQNKIDIAQQELASLGMYINPLKSKLLTIRKGEVKDENDIIIQNQIVHSVNSLKVLGTFISRSHEERIKYFEEKVKKSLQIILSVSKIHLQSFLHIVRHCISTKLNHLVRSMLLPKQLLVDYDNIIIAIITKTLQLSDKFNADLINCPMRKGGLGIAALQDIQSLSITASQQYVCCHSVYLQEIVKQMKESIANEENDFQINIFPKCIPNQIYESFKTEFGVLKCYIKLQSSLTIEQVNIIESKGQHGLWLELSEEKLQNILLEANEEMKVTLHSTSSVESSAWLRVFPYAPYQKMQDDEFKSSCSNRLGDENKLQGIINRMRKAKIYYGKCPKCGSNLTPYHYSCCRFTQSTRSARHHCLKLLIAQYLREIPGVYVKVEDTSALNDEIKESRRVPDIVVSCYDQSPLVTEFEHKYLKSNRNSASFFEFGIDITVPEDHAIKHSSQAKCGKLTEKLEKIKNEVYKEYTKTHSLVVVPMVITSNGNYGKCTNDIIKLMKELCKRNKVIFPKTQLTERISLLLESSRFQMKEIFFNELQRLTVQGEMRIAKKTHITLPKLSDDINYNYSNSFWKTQLKIAAHLISGKDPLKLKTKIIEEKAKAKYLYEPKNDPPPKPPNITAEPEEDEEQNIFINNNQIDSNDIIYSNNSKPINDCQMESIDKNNKNVDYSNEEEINLND